MSEPAKNMRNLLRNEFSTFTRLESILFTTFNFDAGFFERNVLPAALDLEPNRNAEISRVEVNNKLLDISVSVLYDATLPVSEAGEYRYQARAMHVPNGFFHAKLTIAAGWEDQDRFLLVVCSSANLTYSAWAANEESSSYVWLDGQNTQPFKAIYAFLSYLKHKECQNVDALNNILSFMKKMEKIDKQARYYYNPELYISAVHNGGFPGIFSRERKRWDTLVAYSPYWGSDITWLKEYFRANEVCLRPALHKDLNSYGLPLNELTDELEKRGIFFEQPPRNDKRQKEYRFRHAKVYALNNSFKARLGIGSCNFTKAGLGLNKSSNVEAMLMHTINFRNNRKNKEWEIFLEFIPDWDELPINTLCDKSTNVPEEHAPDPLPFRLEVMFDWISSKYTITWEPDKKTILCSLILPGIKNPITKLSKKKENVLTSKYPPDKRIFEIFYKVAGEKERNKRRHSSIIFEINLDNSKRKYVNPLSAIEILDCWRLDDEHLSNTTLRKAAENTADAIPAIIETETRDLMKEMFSSYQAFLQLERRLKKKENPDILFLRGPHSLRSFVERIDANKNNEIIDYLMLLEVTRLIHHYGKKYRQLAKFTGTLLKKRKIFLLKKFKKIHGKSARYYLIWIEKKLRAAWK